MACDHKWLKIEWEVVHKYVFRKVSKKACYYVCEKCKAEKGLCLEVCKAEKGLCLEV